MSSWLLFALLSSDPVFQVQVEEGNALLEALQQPWQVQERSLETDISALRWVEDLEQRVITADLHLKVRWQGGGLLQHRRVHRRSVFQFVWMLDEKWCWWSGNQP